MRLRFTLPLLLACCGTAVAADEASFSLRSLTPEAALKAAQATLKKCRADGYQVAVAVVDRSGNPQVMLRDRFAGPHTPETAISKAWTAVSFRAPTSALAEETQAGRPMSGIRHLPRVAMLGGIGVSGAPGGDKDEACARAGLAAIQADLEL